MSVPKFNVEVATVRCEPTGREAKVVHDTNLLDAVLQTGLGLGQSCGEEERRMLVSQHAGDKERLACCARVNGPVTITADYW
jgi:ferredoxin